MARKWGLTVDSVQNTVASAIQMNVATQDIIFVTLAVFAGLFLLSAYRRRHSIAKTMRFIFITMCSYVLGIIVAAQFTQDPIKRLLFALVVGLVVAEKARPRKQSRYIPRRERRRAIARYERSGRRYDPTRHHLDHVVPHSRGGSNTADNLRVIDGEENLAKSDHSPWWDIFTR